jgi:periplasmic divalent cation tolerance protein
VVTSLKVVTNSLAIETGVSILEIWQIITTVGNRDEANRIVTELVQGRFAACVQIDSSIESVYRWNGQVETGQEIRIVIKTSSEAVDRCMNKLRDLHPYEVPQIVALPYANVDAPYRDWVIESCREQE